MTQEQENINQKIAQIEEKYQTRSNKYSKRIGGVSIAAVVMSFAGMVYNFSTLRESPVEYELLMECKKNIANLEQSKTYLGELAEKESTTQAFKDKYAPLKSSLEESISLQKENLKNIKGLPNVNNFDKKLEEASMRGTNWMYAGLGAGAVGMLSALGFGSFLFLQKEVQIYKTRRDARK